MFARVVGKGVINSQYGCGRCNSVKARSFRVKIVIRDLDK